jgi:hypothetical protein
VEPDPATARAAGRELGALALEPAPEPRDALFEWLSVRNVAFKHAPSPRPARRALRDGHRIYIEDRERLVDRERAARMSLALTECRKAARRHKPLTFSHLARLAAIVLGKPEVRFRKGVGLAKSGREVYRLTDEAEKRFSECLSQADDAADPVAVRAARVYLDVCFFHPFEDGNARVARLALDHVLTSAGLLLESAEPLFVVARAASDADGAWSLARLVDYLAASG